MPVKPSNVAPIVVMIAILGMVGCSEGDTPGLEIVTRSGVTALIATKTEGGGDAQVIGTLVVGPGECLALEDEYSVRPIVWPEGSTLADDGQSIEIARSGPTVRVGEVIDGGGGEFDSPHESTTFQDVPGECLRDYDAVVELSSWGRMGG